MAQNLRIGYPCLAIEAICESLKVIAVKAYSKPENFTCSFRTRLRRLFQYRPMLAHATFALVPDFVFKAEVIFIQSKAQQDVLGHQRLIGY